MVKCLYNACSDLVLTFLVLCGNRGSRYDTRIKTFSPTVDNRWYHDIIQTGEQEVDMGHSTYTLYSSWTPQIHTGWWMLETRASWSLRDSEIIRSVKKKQQIWAFLFAKWSTKPSFWPQYREILAFMCRFSPLVAPLNTTTRNRKTFCTLNSEILSALWEKSLILQLLHHFSYATTESISYSLWNHRMCVHTLVHKEHIQSWKQNKQKTYTFHLYCIKLNNSSETSTNSPKTSFWSHKRPLNNRWNTEQHATRCISNPC